jgi:hypothetical protein
MEDPEHSSFGPAGLTLDVETDPNSEADAAGEPSLDELGQLLALRFGALGLQTGERNPNRVLGQEPEQLCLARRELEQAQLQAVASKQPRTRRREARAEGERAVQRL